MSRRPLEWRGLVSKRSGKIFLLSWVFATLVFVGMMCAILIVHGNFPVDNFMISVMFSPLLIVVSFLIYAIPAFFVALCVLFVSLFYADIDRAENLVLTIVSIVSGLLFGIPASGSLIAIGLGAVTGFLSAVVALIMTKDVRVGFHADESSP